MKVSSPSTNVAGEIQQDLIKKALSLIGRRQFLFKNMNVFSLGKLSQVIQQINQQQSSAVQSNTITQMNDLSAIPFDNMMSVSQVKLMPCSAQAAQYSQSQSSSKNNKESKKVQFKSKKKEKLTIVDLLEEDNQPYQNILTTCYSIEKQEKQQDSAQVQVFRKIKHREYEQKLKKKDSQQKKKLIIPINLNNERLMYGYDSKVIRLEKMKQKQNHSIYKMNSSLINLEQDLKKNKTFHKRLPISISNKINITQKLIEQEKEIQADKKMRRQYKTIVQSPPTVNIRVNPQSHKQVQQAISVKSPGVKISIQKRQFSAQQRNRLVTNHQLTRSQYLQIKSNEHLQKFYFRQPNFKVLDRVKANPERVKTQYVNESPVRFSSGKKYKLSLNTSSKDSKYGKAKILTHNIEAKEELLKQVPQKQTILETIDDSSSSKQDQSLSSVDRYNLLYLKYKGNPPKISQQSTLQSQSKKVREKRPLLTFSKTSNQEKVIRP